MVKLFSSDHPAIIPYNGNLITVWTSGKSNKEVEKMKAKVKELVDANLDIAVKTYSENSIHVLYHIQGTLINRIGIEEITTPSQANPQIKKMRAIITEFHGGDPRRVDNQLFF
jgi:hypothetical protein